MTVGPNDQQASDRLLRALEDLGIEHQPTVAEAARVRGSLDAAATKNLFVRDKRVTMWTITALADREIDLLALRPILKTRGRLAFGSEQRLRDYLGLRPGSVSPLAAFQDTERQVGVVLDAGLREHTHVLAHPLINTRTTRLRVADLEKALIAWDHPPIWGGL